MNVISVKHNAVVQERFELIPFPLQRVHPQLIQYEFRDIVWRSLKRHRSSCSPRFLPG